MYRKLALTNKRPTGKCDGHAYPRVAILAGIACLCTGWSGIPVQGQTLAQRLKAESVVQLAADARQQGDAVRGAILFTGPKLSCTKCHVRGAERPIGPELMGLGKDVSDVYLIEALLEPSKAIKAGFESVRVLTKEGVIVSGRIVEESADGLVLQPASGDLQRIKLDRAEIDEIAPSRLSAMPENLVDQLGDRRQFLDLVRYLIEMSAMDAPRPLAPTAGSASSLSAELQGIVLLKDFNCQACHQDDVTRASLPAKEAPNLLRSVGCIDPHFMQQFMMEPTATRPGTSMPNVMSQLPDDERRLAAREITHYLVSLNDQRFSHQPVQSEAAARGQTLFHEVGCVACHSPRNDEQQEILPDSSVPLGAVHHKYNVDGLTEFLENPLETRPSGRMPQTPLSHWQAVDLASYLLSQADPTTGEQPFELQPELVLQGKARFEQLGCSQCHRVDSATPLRHSLPMSQLRADQGCLSTAVGAWPSFDLSQAQRDAIRQALSRPVGDLSEAHQVQVALTAFRCVNCHEREELGGVSAERDSYFQTTNQNLGPQGRIPPSLTGVGAKLNAGWMRQVMVSGRAIRPYLLTKMPQFGAQNVGFLVEKFQRLDQLPAVEFPHFEDAKKMRETGTELVGTAGLNCIVCHTFQLQQAANMPAVDLTEMSERLKKDWFFRYMRDPQSLSRNTIMPTFWPAGRALRTDILDGNAELQIEAIWQYLLEGREARAPRGLVVEPIKLLATDEAVMLRRSYAEVGKRGIGVGYAHELNLVFDAEQMRLAMIWKGGFADPAGVWRSQGHGNVRPLGDGLMKFAPGPDLDWLNHGWMIDEGRPVEHQFSGYALDENMRPRFKYRFAGLRVEDYLVDLVDPASGKAFFRRSLTLRGEPDQSGLAFRAASGQSIVQQTPTEFVIDDRLHVHIASEQQGVIIQGAESSKVQIPLDVVNGSASLILEYHW